jgi:hypothetical protein
LRGGKTVVNVDDAPLVAQALVLRAAGLVELATFQLVARDLRRPAVDPQRGGPELRWDLAGTLEECLEPASALQPLPLHPELLEVDREPEPEPGVVLERPIERCPHVVLLGNGEVVPHPAAADSLDRETRGLRHGQEVLGVPPPDRTVSPCLEPFDG